LNASRQTSCLAIPANLGTLLGFIAQACKESGLDEEIGFAVRLAGEEACSNVINHAYAGVEPGPISLELRAENDRVVLLVEDRAPAFSPDDAPPPELSADWENKPLGGLGWHLIRQVMDEVHHERLAGGGNRLELVKRRRLQVDAQQEGSSHGNTG
jgi:serine/threonine-protein kinase RsbW